MGEKFDPNKHDALFQVGMFRNNVIINYVALVGISAGFAIYPLNFIHPYMKLIININCKF